MYLSVFLQTLERRQIALKNINWSKEHKARAVQIMTIPYMSSEEEEEEEEEECESQTRRLVKKLPWISLEALKVKEDLDEHRITTIETKSAYGPKKGCWQQIQHTITWVAGWHWPLVGYIVTIILYSHGYVIIWFEQLI